MSQPPKKGPGKPGKKINLPVSTPTTSNPDDLGQSERTTPVSKDSDTKEDLTSQNGDKKPDEPQPKPPSAGASIRDAVNKLLHCAMKSEWTPCDQTLKTLEKYVAGAGEDGNKIPLAGVVDPGTGMTPLMYAVKDNRSTLIDRMIELGSDVSARNNDNYNVLHIASMYSREDVVKLLLNKRGVDPFSTGGSRAQTAVHLVASRQTGTATSILRSLLAAAGKDIRLKTDGRGKIPLLLAVEAGNQSMCRELLSSQTVDQLKNLKSLLQKLQPIIIKIAT